MLDERPTTPATANWVARARAGDADAWEALSGRTAGRLLLYIRLRLGPKLRGRLDSMDVLQETWLQAYTAIEDFELRYEEGFHHWLCRIAEYRIRDLAEHFDAQKRRPPAPPAPISSVMEQLRDTGTGPFRRAAQVRQEAQERLFEALDVLEGAEREVLLLRFFQHLTFDESATEVGRSASSVRRMIGRTLIRLGDALQAGDGEVPHGPVR